MRQTRISLAIITLTLLAFGIIMVYSSSAIIAYEQLNDSLFFLKRHLLYILIGLSLGLAFMAIDYSALRRCAKPLVLLVLASLALVLVPHVGHSAGGAKRWFKFGVVSFQPSEFAKLAVIIYLADFITRKRGSIQNFRQGFLPPLIVVGLIVLLVLAQPDLGTAISLGAIFLLFFFAAGAPVRHISGLLIAAAPLFYYLVFHVPYRRMRMLAFLNPWQDPQGSGFQIIQSLIALGSGGLFGVGLGASKQKLFYLPAAHTDFILAIIGEELGLLGTLSVVCLFFLFLLQALRISLRTDEPFGGYLSLGLASMIGLETIINVGASTGALPTKGLPLPFISYGGSNMVFNILGVALLLNVARGSEDIK